MTSDVTFDYTAVSPSGDEARPDSIIASRESVDQPLQAVVWSVRQREWIYAPGPAARLLYDDQQFERLEEIDRGTAERMARDFLNTELPSEPDLLRLCVVGAAAGRPSVHPPA